MTRLVRVACVAALLGLIALGACQRQTLDIRSREHDVVLRPAPVTAVYRYDDSNTMDIVVSDLPLTDLVQAIEAGNASGNVTHIHLFFRATPGQTALDPTASNSTIRHVVFASNEVGVYGGGGLLRISTDGGAPQMGATVRDATVRLLYASDGFIDRLGAAELSGAIRAERDDSGAMRVVNLLNRLYLQTDAHVDAS